MLNFTVADLIQTTYATSRVRVVSPSYRVSSASRSNMLGHARSFGGREAVVLRCVFHCNHTRRRRLIDASFVLQSYNRGISPAGLDLHLYSH